MLVGGYGLCLTIIHYERMKNDAIFRSEREQRQLERALRLDGLTGLYNRTALRESFERLEEERPRRAVLAMLDLDRFKQLNDTYGHPRGDACLVQFAGILREGVGGHPIFRYGGDEFCILFQGESVETAARYCRRICGMLEHSELHRRFGMGASVGLAEYVPGLSGQELLARADEALYQAKAAGGGVYLGKEDTG